MNISRGAEDSCPGLCLGLLIRMKYIIMANTKDIEQAPLGVLLRRSRLPALLIYIVDFYQRRHVNVILGPCSRPCLCVCEWEWVCEPAATHLKGPVGPSTALSATRVMNA